MAVSDLPHWTKTHCQHGRKLTEHCMICDWNERRDQNQRDQLATLKAENARLREIVNEAANTAEACQALHNEQVDLRFQGKRADWRRTSWACFDEIDGKPEKWRNAAKALENS